MVLCSIVTYPGVSFRHIVMRSGYAIFGPLGSHAVGHTHLGRPSNMPTMLLSKADYNKMKNICFARTLAGVEIDGLKGE